MESRLLTDAASVSSSLTHSTDLSNSSTSNNFPSIKCNLSTGIYADNLYACQNNPKYLKKLNFVVCSERTCEIHESEKSYRKKKKAQNIIDLAAVYSITKRTNAKTDLCLMLVTSEQTFFLRAPTEVATHEWYGLLISNIHTSRSLVQGRQISYNDFPECIWDVKVVPKTKLYRKDTDEQMCNLCSKDKRALGRKRLCFFPHAVVLVQMHTEPANLTTKIEADPNLQEPENYFYFARPFISFYGCQRKYFFIKASTSAFGTCEIVMDCENNETSAEIFAKFRSSANKNVNVEEESWQNLMNDAEHEDDEEDEYYKSKSSDNGSSSENTGMLTEATSYCADESQRKRPIKEVRFKTEDQPDLQAIEKIPREASIDDGIVGQKIAADILRRNSNKPPVKKSTNPINGFFASIKRKFMDRGSPPSPIAEEAEEDTTQLPPGVTKNNFRHQIDDLRYWAEHRASTIEEETEDSGGTLKIDDPTQPNPKPKTMSIEERRAMRRDDLFAKAILERTQAQAQASKKVVPEVIEMVELSSSNGTDESNCATSTESSSCDHSINESEPETNPKVLETTMADNNSGNSSSAVDSCISNTSEDFSATSSVSNVEYTWRPKKLRPKKHSLDSRSCAGRYTSDQSQGQSDEHEASDLSADSCYSSLTNHGYQQLPKSQSLTQIICESPIETTKKAPSKKMDKLKQFKLDNSREVAETPEEPAKASMKTNRSTSDLASHAQQITLKSTLVKQNDPESVAAAIRQRAASLGNKSWAITPLGQSLKRHRHRQDCKKRKMNTSTNNSLSEEQPLLDTRHSSISSQSDNSCSHKNNAETARTRLAHALLRKNPRRSNTSDLAEMTFSTKPETCSTGCGSIGSVNSSEFNEFHRETVQAFSGTNRDLIPTTRYSEGSNTNSRKTNRARRAARKGFEMDTVECFVNPDDFDESIRRPNKAASVSSRSSGDDLPRCKHGRPKRHTHSHSNHSLDSGDTRHSCRRKHRTSCQDAIVEEDYVVQVITDNSHQRDTVSSIDSKTLTESDRPDAPSTVNSDTSSQKSEDPSADMALDLINNNPNPVSIFA